MTITVQRIVDLMEHYGSSGAFMSRLCGKSRTLVASWQAGKSVPTASDIATIAARYGVSEAYLRGEVDPGVESFRFAEAAHGLHARSDR